MNKKALADAEKPSVISVGKPTPEGVPVSPFHGMKEFLDFNLLERAFAAEMRKMYAERMYAENPDAEAALDESKTVIELIRIAEDVNSASLPGLKALDAVGGRLPKVDKVAVVIKDSVMTLSWVAKGYGFGEMQIYPGERDKLMVDAGGASRHMLRAVLLRLADDVLLEK